MGKSRQALLAAEGRTLIIAPAMILDVGVWQQEVERWRPDLDVRALSYNRVCASVVGPKGGRVPIPKPSEAARGPWDTVICDEAHYLKGRKTKWTLAIEKIKTDRLYLLTGTAIPNWAYEVFMLLKLCHPGDPRFTSYWRWVARWFTQNVIVQRGHPTRQIGGLLQCLPECDEFTPDHPCEHWLEFRAENLSKCYLRRVRDDVLADLPPLTEQTFEVPMTTAQARVYKALKKDFIAWTEAGNELVAWNQAAQATDLAKCATGVELLDPTSPASGKLDLLSELLSERKGQHTLILCHFRATADACVERARALGLSVEVLTGAVSSKGQRKAIVSDFQAGKTEVLVGSLELVKEGLTLHRADQAILVEHSWRPSTNEQVIRRIHRIGQERPVSVIHLVTKGTVDARMQRVIQGKTDQQVRALPVQRLVELL